MTICIMHFIDTPEALDDLCIELKNHSLLAIDLECENSLYHYGVYVSIIQISTREENYIIDILKLGHLGGLKEIFEDGNITKIFHDVDFDFRILFHEFECHPKNIFDTLIAAHLLNKPRLGLGGLLEDMLDVHVEKKYQTADWTKRPLTEGMLSYAVNDTKYSIPLKEKLEQELIEKGRLEWAKEMFARLDSKDFDLQIPTFLELKGVSNLTDEQRGVLKELYFFRERIAKKVDKPIHFIINNRRLVEFACEPPQDWFHVQGVHPVIKRSGKFLEKIIERGRKEPISVEKIKPKRMSLKQRKLLEQFQEVRDKIAKEQNLPPHLVATRDQLIQYIAENKDTLYHWQQELLSKHLENINN